jgi:signal transduction histidine kinase
MCLAYIVVAAVTEVVGYNTQSQNLHRQLESRARADAIILAAGTVGPLSSSGPRDIETLQNVVGSLKGAQGVSYAAVYGGNGCIVASTIPPRPPSCLTSILQLGRGAEILSNGDVAGRAPVADQETELGLAMVVVSGASVQNDLRSTLAYDLVLRSVGLVIFLILTLAIAQYILGPLTVLARAAGDISRGRLDTRVPPGGHTELATVAAAFNEMAGALQQRIQHLSFLAAAAPTLPMAFRDDGDISPTLGEFCEQMATRGVGLLPSDQHEQPPVWYDAESGDPGWHDLASSATESVHGPAAVLKQDWEVMVVPLLGNTVFVTVRDGERPFSREEQQVITNFAHQLGVAADNARLFESQQEALQVKDQFLSIVSHELRTPLTTIKGYAQMLRRKLANDPDGLRFAANIDAQVSRLGRLVDDLLDVTRFSRSQFDLKRQRIDLRPLLDDALSRFRIMSPTHTFRLELDQGPFEGNWDRDRLEQVLNNLIGNAIKYSPAGGTVTLVTRHEDGMLLVGVRDEGVGISEEDQKHLFERFFRGDAEGGNVKGLGLGLYVTHRIVDAHGGEVHVRSKPGEGSEFYFSLPLLPQAVPAAASR